MWATPTVLFHETFGNNTGSARAWDNSYSVKSGVSAVYSGITGYTVSNVKQGKNTTGSTQSGLNQSTQGVDAYIIIGPLNVAKYSSLGVTYQWKAASTKGTYTTKLEYATSSGGSYTEVSGTGAGATSFVERSYSLPAAAQVSTLYLKITWNTSNTQGIIDEVELTGVSAVTTYGITKSATNGTISTKVGGSEVTTAAKDATVTIEATPSTGYSFSSWSVTKTSGGEAVSVTNASANPTTFTMPAEAVTVAATFTINTHALDLTSTNGTCAVTVNGEDWDGSSAIAYGADVEITATPDDGFLFDEWDHTLTSPTISSNVISFSMPDDDVVIEAKFVDASTVKSITISDAIEHGTVTASSNTASAGDEITLTATPDAGYAFSSWSVVDESSNVVTVTNNKFTMPGANVTVSATFTAIPVTGVSLNKTSTTISVGETETLTATVAPANALNPAVTWTSSNTDVATVANGVVTAKAAGSATITVTTTDGGFTATCAVTVVNAVTFDATKDTGTSSIEKSGVTFECDNCVLNNGSEYRLYKNSETTFSVSTGKITKIEFTGVSGNPASGFESQSGWTTDGNDGTWTGKSSSVSFTASGAQVRATEIKVYYATTATPTFSVATGEYSEAKSVTISCATDGASIYYTTDGTTPTSSSNAYSSAISIVETTTLKAIAIKDGVDSEVASATYTMNRPATPTFDVAAGVFDAAFDLHLATETDGATIYYTTDGSTPTTSSPDYSDKVAISAATTTVKAIAVKSGLTSDVASATYTYDARTTPTFTLSTTSIDLKVNETSSAVTLTTNSDVTPSFTCADSHVTLTGTGNSRTITADAEGVYSVNVSVTGSLTYKDAAGVITVTVTKKATTMAIETTFPEGTDLKTASSGSIAGIVKYNDAALSPQPTITYSSSDEKVATVNASGVITFKKVGTTTITASYEGNDEYVECEAEYVLTLIDTTPQETEVSITLNNTFFGCEAFTSYSKGDPTSHSSVKNNVTVTYDKGTGSGSGFYCNASGLRLYTGGVLSFEAPSGYYITQIVLAGDDSFEDGLTNPEASTTWTGASSAVNVTGESKSGSTRKNITGATVTLAPTVTISDKKFASYCSPHRLDFSETDVKAYKASVNNTTGKVTLTKVDVVPVGEGVILYCESAGTYAIPVTEAAASDVTGNQMKGVLERTQVVWNPTTGIYNYILQQGQFNKASVDGGYLKANRAYLQTSFNIDEASARSLEIVFEDEETTAIKAIDNEKLTIDSYYDLSGRKVAQPQKGLYIVNGKKVIIK